MLLGIRMASVPSAKSSFVEERNLFERRRPRDELESKSLHEKSITHHAHRFFKRSHAQSHIHLFPVFWIRIGVADQHHIGSRLKKCSFRLVFVTGNSRLSP